MLCPTITKEHNSHMNGVEIHDQLKSTYETDWKSKCDLRVFFDLKDSVVVNAHIIYKTKVNARMRLFHFKVIFAKLLINRFSSRKQKFTSEKPQLALELPQTLKEAPHIILFTDNDQNPLLTASPILFPSVFRRTEIVSSCTIQNKNCYNNLTM